MSDLHMLDLQELREKLEMAQEELELIQGDLTGRLEAWQRNRKA